MFLKILYHFLKFNLIYYIIIIIIKINSNFNKENESLVLPKISIYLPVYNKEKYLLNSIKSIQMQSLNEVEIIIINDNSTDNSLNILKRLIEKDHRIKILNNNKNYGVLYCRIFGMLKSSGEYIMSLDPDDRFTKKNNLKYLYQIANKLKVDLLSFAYSENNRYDIKCYNFNNIIKQPLLFESAFFIQNYGIKDYLLWNKLIKKNIIIKIYNLFKKKINLKWNYGEDTILSILINKIAKSMICIKKVIYKYNRNVDSLMSNRYNTLEIQNRLYILEMLREIFNKENENKYIEGYLEEFFIQIKDKRLFSIIKNNTDIKGTLINILKISEKHIRFSESITKSINNLINILN